MRDWKRAMRTPLAVCLALAVGCSPERAEEAAAAPSPVALPLFVDWYYPPEANPRMSGLAAYYAVDAFQLSEERQAALVKEVEKHSAGGSRFVWLDGIPAIVPAVPGVSCLDVPLNGALADCTLWEATEHVLRSIACDERFRDKLSLGFTSGLGPGMPESYWSDRSHRFDFDGLTAREALLEIIRASEHAVNFVVWNKAQRDTGEKRSSCQLAFYIDGVLQKTSIEDTPEPDAPVRRAIDMQRAVTPLENSPEAAEDGEAP